MLEFFSTIVSNDVLFVRYALIASALSSLPLGMIGSFVVVRNMGAIAGAIGHSIVGGVGLAVYLQVVLRLKWATPQLGALVFAIFSGLVIAWLSIRGRQRLDTAINTVWVVGMSLGLVFLSLTPTYTDPMSYLFGNILLISESDLLIIGILSLVVVSTVVGFYPQLQSISFDEEFSRVRGLPVNLLNTLLLLLVAITVFLMIQVVGILMVIALVTLPAAISSLFHKKLLAIMTSSAILTFIFLFLGIMVSFVFNLPTGPTTVLILGSTYGFAVLVVGKLRSLQ